MTAQLPEYPRSDTALLDVDRAHKALEQINDEIEAAVRAATAAINAKYTPVMYASQSVLYEAMGKAAEAGFSRDQMCEVMQCDGH